MDVVKQEIEKILSSAGVTGDINLSVPPKPELGDYAFGCFEIAKEMGRNPVDIAKSLATNIEAGKGLVAKVTTAGPYLNFYLNNEAVAALVLNEISSSKNTFGKHKSLKKHKLMVEFAHPNTHKAFHIGHLRNIVTGESLVRILENDGNQVIRANYQGDVGLHIAKCLYAITTSPELSEQVSQLKTLPEQVKFLGAAYASGSQAYEASEEVQAKVALINQKIYARDAEIIELYTKTREWSLNYFNLIYARLNSHFDRLFFESEVFVRGRELVHKNTPKIFKESNGATIFPGSEYGLHDRVFLNSQGLPTYEAKDLALAEKQFAEFKPDAIYHVVAKEQSDYFKVIFKAIEQVFPDSEGREHHLVYGWVRLKEGKMSSRTGQVVLCEWLLDEVKAQILELMEKSEVAEKASVAETVAIAAVKYAMLKTGVENDIAFDIKESISLTGDSGPYLLYVCARIHSILRKVGAPAGLAATPSSVALEEKSLLLELSRFPEVAAKAAATTDPSQICRYVFSLAQKFNNFYHACPVLAAEGEVKNFRLSLISATLQVATHGLELLGIKTVEEM